MSTHKTTADQEIVVSFVKETFSDSATNFEVVHGGEGSQAYSFCVGNKEYIIRINKHHTLGFKKDEYAFAHYASPSIPIPKIHKIGRINSDLRFCISEKVSGRVLTTFSSKETELLKSALFDVLDSIHAVDIKRTNGYGKWNSDGEGETGTWKEYLLSVNKYANGLSGSPGLFETTFLEKDYWDDVYTQFSGLVLICPEERYLVHGDFGFDNVLSDGNKITGVIDWENSMYADFLFDVGWLSFWSQSVDFERQYLERSEKRGQRIENFHKRILCYKLYIGLSSMSFYAYSNQREKYDITKIKIGSLLLT